MPSSTARYTGPSAPTPPFELTEQQQREIQNCYLECFPVEQSPFLETATIVTNLLGALSWVPEALEFHSRDITKQEMRVELEKLHKTLRSASKQLKSVSTINIVLLNPETDLVGAAEKLDVILGYIDEARPLIGMLPNRPSASDVQHLIAIGVTTDTLRVLKRHGILVTAAADKDLGYISPTVYFLKKIGEVLGLWYSEVTWRDFITQSRKEAKDLIN